MNHFIATLASTTSFVISALDLRAIDPRCQASRRSGKKSLAEIVYLPYDALTERNIGLLGLQTVKQFLDGLQPAAARFGLQSLVEFIRDC